MDKPELLVKGKSTPGKSEHRLSFQKTSVENHGLEPEAMTSPGVLVKSAGSRLNTTHAPLETREPKKTKKKKKKERKKGTCHLVWRSLNMMSFKKHCVEKVRSQKVYSWGFPDGTVVENLPKNGSDL